MSAIPHPLRAHWGLGLAERRVIFLIGDLLVTALAAGLSLWLWSVAAEAPFTLAFVQARWPWLVLLPLSWMALNLGAYDLHRSPDPADAWREVLTVGVLALGLYLLVFFFAPRNLLPRLLVLYFITSAALLGLGWRLVHNRLFSLPYFQRRLLILGGGQAGHEIIQTISEFQPANYSVVGVIDDDPRKHRTVIGGAPVLGGHERLLPALRALNVSEVVLAIHGDIDGATFQALIDSRAQGVPIIRMTSLYEQITGRVPLDHLDADWVVAAYMDQNRVRDLENLTKRALDIVIAGVGLLALGLILPLIAAAIWLESPGPIFYRQTRLGRGGRPFAILKFRSMVPDAEANGQARWATPDDQRVTRVGWVLRRTRLDEAPQLWNVLMGEMSVVGPRPERPEFTADLERQIPFYRARLIVRPGITGWAQVNYGYTATVADAAVKLQWDLYYIKHRSLWLDVLILWRTIGVVIGLKGT